MEKPKLDGITISHLTRALKEGRAVNLSVKVSDLDMVAKLVELGADVQVHYSYEVTVKNGDTLKTDLSYKVISD